MPLGWSAWRAGTGENLRGRLHAPGGVPAAVPQRARTRGMPSHQHLMPARPGSEVAVHTEGRSTQSSAYPPDEPDRPAYRSPGTPAAGTARRREKLGRPVPGAPRPMTETAEPPGPWGGRTGPFRQDRRWGAVAAAAERGRVRARPHPPGAAVRRGGRAVRLGPAGRPAQRRRPGAIDRADPRRRSQAARHARRRTRSSSGSKLRSRRRCRMLTDADIDPAPDRSATTWAGFLRSQAGGLLTSRVVLLLNGFAGDRLRTRRRFQASTSTVGAA